ncbi:hypothetical protein MAE02_66100 [Microvirga aerophila]|uniref:Uncharacterized protein n=1 Tax=Microvirga aerophila TaxID=670291 RepID=A0A512C3Y3_9HYPH|nr:hypothetical protein MAE02_66100 [Microvirga aerophila]
MGCAPGVPLASFKLVLENPRGALGLVGRNEQAKQRLAIVRGAEQTDCITDVGLFGTGAH